MKINITVRFTGNHVSIRRGRVTRSYQPGIFSTRRLVHVLNMGACECEYTQRASVYHWHGRSTLNRDQKIVFGMLMGAMSSPFDSHTDVSYICALRNVARAIGMHEETIESAYLCEHGNIHSKCPTCQTTM